MIIMVRMKSVLLRGKTYYFRMGVPTDCIEAIGRTEITQSLKTGDELEARTKSEKLRKIWAAKFAQIRKPVAPAPVALQDFGTIVEEFRYDFSTRAEKALLKLFETCSAEKLRKRSEAYQECIALIRRGGKCSLRLPEIDLDDWPPEAIKNHRLVRVLSRELVAILNSMRLAIDEELGEPFSEQKKYSASEKVPASGETTKPSRRVAAPPLHKTDSMDIAEVASLMLAARRRVAKTVTTVRADIRLLKAWTGKGGVADFTKKDMIDFVQNCLPYIPSNMMKKKAFAGKSIRECIKLTKDNPDKYIPISHTTCENRLVNISMVFNYAREQLGLVSINPAKGIDIPEVRVIEDRPRGFTRDELSGLWAALHTGEQRPLLYWATVLSLYHGFRLNEVCSLFVDDVYEDEDGIFVIDINESDPTKSVKNQSSIRIVPVHPFVLDGLNFRGYVEQQKADRTTGVLFPEATFVESKGYMSKVSKWFGDWKLGWLSTESQYKHFHDLRYTFIQTAQNVAGMSDRCSQEITGHSVEGVSAVHLGYSGRLKPAAVLKELQNVMYGWEVPPREVETPPNP
jgi:integrase